MKDVPNGFIAERAISFPDNLFFNNLYTIYIIDIYYININTHIKKTIKMRYFNKLVGSIKLQNIINALSI